MCLACVLVVCLYIPAFAAEPAVPYATPTRASYLMTGVGAGSPRMYLSGSGGLQRNAQQKWMVTSYHGTNKLYTCDANGRATTKVLQTTGSSSVTVGPESTNAKQTEIGFFTVNSANNRIAFTQYFHMVNGAKWYDRCLQSNVRSGITGTGSYAENYGAQMWEVR